MSRSKLVEIRVGESKNAGIGWEVHVLDESHLVEMSGLVTC